MGRSKIPGIYPAEDGCGWQINSRYKGEGIRRRGFTSASEAEAYLIQEKERIRKVKVLGEVRRRTLDDAAAYYIKAEAARGKVSLITDVYLLKRVIATIGDLPLDHISQQSIEPFVKACRIDGLKNKSINNAIGVIVRICNLASRAWRDENGNPWLNTPPLIRKLPLDDQRPPRPITWSQQRTLLTKLPEHLARMVLFDLQVGARESVVCQLQWSWEVKVSLEEDKVISVFIVPKRYVKGRKAAKVLVCNSTAQSIIEGQRGKHGAHVFTYRGEPVASMNNTAWVRSRKEAGLGDLHIHDLRHTVGMRLREAGVREETVSDVLWHSRQSMTAHYSAGQVRELYEALELLKEGKARNLSLLSLVADTAVYQNLTNQRKTA